MDEEGFAKLFLKYKPEVVRVVRGIYPAVDIKDLEEIYDSLWERVNHRAKIAPLRLKTLRAYLVQCLRNQVVNEKMQVGSWDPHTHISLHDPGVVDEVDATYQVTQQHYNLEGEEVDRIEFVLKGLTPLQRTLASHQFLEGTTQAELAKTLGFSERWIRHMTQVVKDHIRARYRLLGVTERNQQLYTKRRR